MFRSASVAALTAAVALAAFPGGASAQNRNPGAMKTNGNFFTYTTCHAGGIFLAEWREGAGMNNWFLYPQGVPFGWTPSSAPTGPALDGTLLFTVGQLALARWNPAGGVATLVGAPVGTVQMSDPCKAPNGNGFFQVVDTGSLSGPQAGRLFSRVFPGLGTWTNLGMPFGTMPLTADALSTGFASAPCVSHEGSVFSIGLNSRVYQRSFLVSPSSLSVGFVPVWGPALSFNSIFWTDHGLPGTGAMFVGAPMSGKVFVTAQDGTLRELRFNSAGGPGTWINHGFPFPGYVVDSPPVATREGSVFCLASNGGARKLFELRFGSWLYHSSPPGVNFLQDAVPVAAYGADRVVVRGSNGNYYMRIWIPSTTWQWRDLGRPPYAQQGC